MLNKFSIEYSERSDDELLELASDRVSLTTEAAAALDAELRRRNLTESDQAKHQHFVKRNEQRDATRRRRKIFGTPERPTFMGRPVLGTDSNGSDFIGIPRASQSISHETRLAGTGSGCDVRVGFHRGG